MSEPSKSPFKKLVTLGRSQPDRPRANECVESLLRLTSTGLAWKGNAGCVEGLAHQGQVQIEEPSVALREVDRGGRARARSNCFKRSQVVGVWIGVDRVLRVSRAFAIDLQPSLEFTRI